MGIEFKFFSKTWQNEYQYNDFLYSYFEQKVDEICYLKNHFDVISQNCLGFGEKAFRYFWYLILTELKQSRDACKFLEIGVYKGSILSLVNVIGENIGLDVSAWGVTPLDETGDQYSKYVPGNYLDDIINTFFKFEIGIDRLHIIKGLSTDPSVGLDVVKQGLYDVIYIDGGHDYLTVLNDLELANKCIRDGGYIVLDDSAWNLKISTWKGHYEVYRAAEYFFDKHLNYKHLFTCGHNRVWQCFWP
jgi:hypothetical protein